jgi:hypothetical protein
MKLKYNIIILLFFIVLLFGNLSFGTVIHDGSSDGNVATTNYVIEQVEAESIRAVAAETNLGAKIDNEIVRSTSADTNLQNNINTYSNIIASKTLGSEGFRQIGALGGYYLDKFIEDTSSRGAARDIPVFTYNISPIADLNVSWNEGDVYDPTNGYYHLAAGSNTLVDNAINYAYWRLSNPNVVSWTTGTRPDTGNNMAICRFITGFGRIMHVSPIIPAGDLPLKTDAGHAAVMPSLVVDGLYYAAIGTNLNQIIEVGGIEYQNMSQRNVHLSKNLTNYGFVSPATVLVTYYHTNTATWVYSVTNQLPIDKWDNGTNIVNCTVSNWYRGVFLSQEGNPAMEWVYPQIEYTNYASALAGDDPVLPPGFEPYVPKCTAYIFQGGDISLREESDYWLDRRFMIRRGTISTGGGSSGSSVPSLYQVLLKSPVTGGILPSGMGNPATDDQAANKGYVDSTINKINANRAYVDSDSGNDSTALLESSILPYKTIQAAIDDAAIVASDSNRFIVTVSPGIYPENITMKNYIGINANSIEATVIKGTVNWTTNYTDSNGTELTFITVFQTNAPAIIADAGADNAYMAVNSCYLRSDYDNDITNKSVIILKRGDVEIYSTTYNELNIIPTNGSESVCNAQIFESTDGESIGGLIKFSSFNSSSIINSKDENDNISITYNHDSSYRGINTVQGGISRIQLNTAGLSYSNNIIIAYNNRATGRIGYEGVFNILSLLTTNNCNLFLGYSANGKSGESGISFKDNRVSISDGNPSNVYWGAATHDKDSVFIINTILSSSLTNYPRRYTNSGYAGNFIYITPHSDGTLLLGGALDMSAENTGEQVNPASGHLRIFIDAVSGFERPYFTDSKGNQTRIGRDSVLTVYNSETNTLQRGELIYITSGISDTSHYVKRAKADSLSTMPCFGIVTSIGGISAGNRGMILRLGRAEYIMDTTSWTAGDKLYVSPLIAGGITNVEPTGTNISQFIGWCNVSATNGSINIQITKPDILGSQLPSYYASESNLNIEINRAGTAETNLQENVNIASNALHAVDTNLQNNINVASNALHAADTNLQGNINVTSNALHMADTNLQNNINTVSNMAMNALAAFDAYITNGWTIPNNKITTIPFIENGSVSGCYDNVKNAFIPPIAGWYEVNAEITIAGNHALTIYLSRCNSSSTNNIQSGGIGALANAHDARINAVLYDDGQTNWYIIRVLENAADTISGGGTNGSSRFKGHFIGR